MNLSIFGLVESKRTRATETQILILYKCRYNRLQFHQNHQHPCHKERRRKVKIRQAIYSFGVKKEQLGEDT